MGPTGKRFFFHDDRAADSRHAHTSRDPGRDLHACCAAVLILIPSSYRRTSKDRDFRRAPASTPRELASTSSRQDFFLNDRRNDNAIASGPFEGCGSHEPRQSHASQPAYKRRADRCGGQSVDPRRVSCDGRALPRRHARRLERGEEHMPDLPPPAPRRCSAETD